MASCCESFQPRSIRINAADPEDSFVGIGPVALVDTSNLNLLWHQAPSFEQVERSSLAFILPQLRTKSSLLANMDLAACFVVVRKRNIRGVIHGNSRQQNP
jgi:hypothetical protein